MDFDKISVVLHSEETDEYGKGECFVKRTKESSCQWNLKHDFTYLFFFKPDYLKKTAVVLFGFTNKVKH